ncbi:unnamed protein product [Linum tenue]|uniref:Uncharacterized protein n=1 Tax=Linum tenue TaxID=586396 RepID=A0AAV0MJ79_9ROSI|nr:unnamed protein product [Linum tenue]
MRPNHQPHHRPHRIRRRALRPAPVGNRRPPFPAEAHLPQAHQRHGSSPARNR